MTGPRRLAAALTALLLPGSALVVTAAAHPGAAAAATPPWPKAPVLHESDRPTSCPPLQSDPNTGDAEPRTPTGRFPWPAPPAGVNPEDYAAYAHTPTQFPPLRPANWGGDYKLTSARTSDPTIYQNPQELCGVEGNSVDKAWQVTTGRPTTVIAITDSGIEWCDPGIVDKIYLNRAALPLPENAQGLTKPQLEAAGVKFTDSDPYDLNGDGVFNVQDYANDPRVHSVASTYGGLYCGSYISPADLIRTFGDSASPYYYGHQGPGGFTEAIAGWNFVDNNNNPVDDVSYGHGTGEAEDSTGAADSATEVGTCPNCMVLPIRVGDSFVAQGDAFAQGVLFAVDSGATLVQEALGTIDETTLDRQAVDYAYAHGVPIVASAADEEAEHHNEPANLPHMIVVNSLTHALNEAGVPAQEPQSYLDLNGCTNYGANISVGVESGSCSSEATGKTGGIVGLAESEAENLMLAGKLTPYPGLHNGVGSPVPLSANEIQQLVTMSADDVDFQTAAPPFPPDNYAEIAPYPSRRYPSQPGYDMYTGYGRIDANKILRWIAAGRIPPEASLNSPDWFVTYSRQQTVRVTGLVAAVRATSYHWMLEIGVGPNPEPTAWYLVDSGHGSRPAHLSVDIPGYLIARLFPSITGGPTTVAGQPAPDKFTFTLRLVVTDNRGYVGMDRRTDFVHEDPTLVAGFPKYLGASVDSPPTFAPIGPHGEDVMLVATSAGQVDAFLPDGSQLPGWPVRTDPLAYHSGERAWTSKQVTDVPRGAILGGVAVGDLADKTGHALDVVAADWTGKVYAWNSQGHLLAGFPVHTSPAFSSAAARNADNRLLPGIVSAPALADLQGNGQLDIVAASMDRHVYAWQPDGRPVPGWPVLVVPPSLVKSVDPTTNRITYTSSANPLQGTKLLDTPAIGNLTGGSGPPDVLVGSNEEYGQPPNISAVDADFWALGQLPQLLSPSNSPVFAIYPNGANHPAPVGAPAPTGFPDPGAFLPGWPAMIADLDAGLLPDVADGTTGSPSLADLNGNGRLEVGVNSSVGPGYILNPDGSSYLGTGPDGKDYVLDAIPPGPLSNAPEIPSLPAVGQGILAPLGEWAPGVSYITPAASAGKALDAALPDEQVPNDNQVDAWSTVSGHFDPAYPRETGDLQFLVQPIVANVGGKGAGLFVVDGTSTYDLRAYNALGQEAPGFPKFTGGWVVNSPAFGPWGTLRDDVLAVGTREGWLYAWTTPTPACAAIGPWPKEHHDLWNTGNLSEQGAPVPRCATSTASAAVPTWPTVNNPAPPPTSLGAIGVRRE
jgi:hypothetical protein